MSMADNASKGLSPRVRGNRLSGHAYLRWLWSIPARAGEPQENAAGKTRVGVYPRACGGTPIPLATELTAQGLSPRVRGNLTLVTASVRPWRSIPARAGEPGQVRDARTRDGVYPRACGGTTIPAMQTWVYEGLSPRVRGNRKTRPQRPGSGGSIPARAGEPFRCRQHLAVAGVYPRACGGTVWLPSRRMALMGLSPRVRGNRLHGLKDCGRYGSIPARAGEPGSGRVIGGRIAVYPRACGGTMPYADPATRREGLSPRVRGNRRDGQPACQTAGSIPARAGEPHRDTGSRHQWTVYPRACGGTMR